MIKRIIPIIAVLILGLSLITISYVLAAENAAEFYKGRTVKIIVGFPPGITPDIVARTYAPKLGEYTGANFVVTNKPGGAGAEATVRVLKAPADGLTIGATASAVYILGWVMNPNIGYSPSDFAPLGSTAPEPLVFVVGINTPYDSVADLKVAKTILIGSSSPGSNYTMGSVTAIKALGLDAKIVTGYRGSTGTGLALQQGEVQASSLSLGAAMIISNQGMVKKPLFVLGNKRVKQLPSVPALSELVQLTGDLKIMNDWWDFMHAFQMLYVRADVPKGRIDYLRGIIRDKIHTDPEFRSRIDLAYKMKTGAYLSGDEIGKKFVFLIEESAKLRELFAAGFEQYRK